MENNEKIPQPDYSQYADEEIDDSLVDEEILAEDKKIKTAALAKEKTLKPLVVNNLSDINRIKNHTKTQECTYDDEVPDNLIEEEYDDEIDDSLVEEEQFTNDTPDLDESSDSEMKLTNTNYLNDMAKKQEKENKKAKGPLHMHLVGNIDKEEETFNKSFGDLSNRTAKDARSADGSSVVSDITTSSTTDAVAADGGDACSEALDIMGLSLIENADKSFVLTDLCEDKDIYCKNKMQLIEAMIPYIQSTFIIPLQVTTNESFTLLEDWANSKVENSDIKYCKALYEFLYE